MENSNNTEYFKSNEILWNQRTKAHIESDFYDNESFLKGRNTLNEAELISLGNIEGKSIIHLQCHFGQDTLSMARMGAKTLGVDISPESIRIGRQLNEQLGLDTQFVCCNVLDTLDHVTDKFDIVFVTYGATCWLPDLKPWAEIVSTLLKPNGILYYHEFHPTFYIIDDKKKKIGYPYYNTGAMVETHKGSYTDGSSELELKEVFWSHSMSELLTACMDVGLNLKMMKEHDFSPYDCFENMTEVSEGKFVIDINGVRLPHTLEMILQKTV